MDSALLAQEIATACRARASQTYEKFVSKFMGPGVPKRMRTHTERMRTSTEGPLATRMCVACSE